MTQLPNHDSEKNTWISGNGKVRGQNMKAPPALGGGLSNLIQSLGGGV